MSDPEWTGSLSYAGDIMASNRNNNINSSSSFNIPGLVSSFGTAPNNTVTAATSTRTLPQHGMETVVGSANGSPVKANSEHADYKNTGEIATEKNQHMHETVEDLETTRTRRCWTHVTWALTWYLPSPFLKWCGRMGRPDVRMAWREKVAICVIIFFIWCVLLFLIIGLGLILCPKEYVWTIDDVASHDSPDDAYVALRGRVYDISDYINQKHGTSSYVASKDLMLMYIGQDVNASFPLSIRTACPALVSPKTDPKYSMYLTPADPMALQVFPFTHKIGTLPSSKELSSQSFYERYVLPTMDHFKKGDIVWDYDWVSSMHRDQGKYWRVINKEVFNLEDYFATIDYPGNTDNKWRFLSNHIENIFDDKGAGGTDVTDRWGEIPWSAKERTANYNCMKNLFYVGKVDDRHSVRCLFTNYMLLAFACVLMAIVLVKFLTALQFGTKNRPTTSSKFVICQVPCYTEDEASLLKTIDSLAGLSYDDKHKLMFIVCDGNIVGSGNDRSTPRIVLDILGVDPEYDPPGRDYLAIAEGSRRHNIAKVYSGLYDFEGHVVPFMVAVKVGTPEESNRSGNRGKRDSQILLMSFLNKVHFDLPMTPLELEIFHQMRHIIGIHPHDFEYILQVDADTEVMPDSLSRLIAACSSDQRIAGICGETMLGNENKSWTTMMQVYEYFISHHMAKAFESLFGSVTCLPGCFCMYRLRSRDGKPLLIAKPVLEAYSELHVDTLHKKNLLSLGEDRYLTTLMMKHFPQFKLKFIQDAKCKTIAPEKWAVLMSQRRRWINSTIHNLAELMFLPDLCGFCCFSMRFVVFLDLFGTLTMPTTLFYFAYLIYIAVTGLADVGIISLILIAAIYGVQAIIFILRREWQHIGWMIIYLLAYPLWSFVLPVYSFWHMDDFSWGNTRVVVGDGKRKLIVSDDKAFDPKSIPQRRWGEYEADLAAAGVLNAPPPNMNPIASSSREDERMTMYSRQSQIMVPNQMRVGSMYGYPTSVAGFGAGGPINPHYAAMGSTRPGTPAALATIPGANGVGDQQRYSMAAAAMTMQQPMDTIRSHVVSIYGNIGNNATDYATVRSPSPAVMTTGQQPASTVAATQSLSYEHAAVGGLDISGVASMPDMMHQQQQQQQQRPMSFAPTAPYPAIGNLHDLGSSPSDTRLVEAIRQILGAADLNSLTKKKVRQQLCQEFNADLTARKDFISDTVDRILSGNL
ncbi:hypothetical protein IW140_002931 [Coemansia sp. RSA 1813]|nr:hypothetical protein EV178_002851 [Coemansia sp. RSA 1646]KAJ1771964.1 hypothetical protein LPJ74_001856 [Coemansia sp. RSA 1843]KAJ2089737.1 hypothetical protein IW138_003193 [Coemansia sp. RSA 986]KAJ2214259.1 hypothetical protein EV179_003161 [Coemansia sp. RSA 487]KAJ2569677.1 hypothetical protein IW140_002931 [Coemansia sp. RSA 1813]